MVTNKTNNGTVDNFYRGLNNCSGIYIKCISPGDMIYGKLSIRKWIDALKENNAKWSFCKTIYYKKENNGLCLLSVKSNPSNIKVYKKNNFDLIRWQYLALGDIAVGASMIFIKDSIMPYVTKILNKVKYAEDNIWRIAMFDGLPFYFYDEFCILYEYGTGISSSKNKSFSSQLYKDWLETDDIILNCSSNDILQKNIQNAIILIDKKKSWKKYFVRGFIKNKLVNIFIPEKSPNYFPVNK